jgi:hypothetical protein
MPVYEGMGVMRRLRALLTALLLVQFGWAGGAEAQTGTSSSTPQSGNSSSSSLTSDECASTTNPSTGTSCYTANGAYVSPPTQVPAPYVGARSDPGDGGGAIDVWGLCRYVDDVSTATSLFVPFRSAPEWSAFIDNAPGGIFIWRPARAQRLIQCRRIADV